MREYIEQWLRKTLVKITKKSQQVADNTIMPPPTQQQPIEDTSTSR